MQVLCTSISGLTYFNKLTENFSFMIKFGSKGLWIVDNLIKLYDTFIYLLAEGEKKL